MTEPESTPATSAPVTGRTPVDTRTASRALLQYSVLRLGLFFVVVVALALAGIRGIVALMISLLVTSVLGFFLLKKQRNIYGAALEARLAEKRQARADLRSRLDEDHPADAS